MKWMKLLDNVIYGGVAIDLLLHIWDMGLLDKLGAFTPFAYGIAGVYIGGKMLKLF